ncbi:MAG: D-sedoheptulose 7-phosphate isomerase [Armatimonadetes bacterium]|nr:D-sedoheptulose 7-phosphate isomerase [Armatimonadota bacterium]
MSGALESHIDASVQAIESCRTLLPKIEQAGLMMAAAIAQGGTVAFCGNGGSAAEAQHLAAELVGRFRRERAAFAAVALTTDSSILTAIGNDYSFDEVFARQVRALLREGDVLVALSTSGNARNVCRGAEAARQLGVRVVGLTGRDGGRLAELCDVELRVPAEETARVQEAHLLIGHLLCEIIEARLSCENR